MCYLVSNKEDAHRKQMTIEIFLSFISTFRESSFVIVGDYYRALSEHNL